MGLSPLKSPIKVPISSFKENIAFRGETEFKTHPQALLLTALSLMYELRVLLSAHMCMLMHTDTYKHNIHAMKELGTKRI